MAPIKSVAVIGAGISGVSSAAHLIRHGFEVVVFERSSVTGGVWHFDPRPDRDPEYPSTEANHTPDGAVKSKESCEARGEDDIALLHAPPGPCYEGLMNNVPTTMMRTTLLQWPEGTPDHVTHHEIETYVQRLSQETGAHDVTLFDTRVEEAVKNASTGKWDVRTKTLLKQGDGKYSFQNKDWTFDAVVVAAGHYHVPLIPEVPGLAEWKSKYPDRVRHSKSYRYPHHYRDQNVLLIGAGVSSLDIAKELDGLANKTYQSSRGGIFDLDKSFLPPNSERVAGLKSFKLDEGKSVSSGSETPGAPIPGTVHLTDGRVLQDIHHVIIASGYQTTYPFLTGLESDSIAAHDADESIIITADKCITHNLHKDIVSTIALCLSLSGTIYTDFSFPQFYMPDPTLTFVGVPYYTSTFSMFEFQAEVVARVYAGLATLPSAETMRSEYAARKAKGETGKAFHSLIRNQVPYMEDILAWVNEGVNDRGIEPMKGVDEAWYRGYEAFKEKSKRLIPVDSNQIQQPIASKYYTSEE
ncbi:putative thiol-specific monooxygenase [Diaporthe ampelina]|uniref:Putative thiol-specific monooxygenase n=1 Tax=Diaporthe ampelina TaxID=1214573 RepID=A0A0G2FKB2_9PEZI|nr:putative thiol-specific monooxygenase [Diaporthe ampelina]